MRKSIDANSPWPLPLFQATSTGLQGLGQADLGSAEGGYSAATRNLEVDCGGITGLLVTRFGGGWMGGG